MAKYTKGVLGPISGKLGTVVGSSWKAVHYMRSHAEHVHDRNSTKQRAQRAAFRLNSACAIGMLPAGRVGLRALATRRTEYNILMHRLFSVGDHLENLRISTGIGQPVEDLAVTLDKAAGKAKVTWRALPAGVRVHVAVVSANKMYSAAAEADGTKGACEFRYGRAEREVAYAYAFTEDSASGHISDTEVAPAH